MSDYILIMKLRGNSWDFIPHLTWQSILHRFILPTCDGFSLDTVTSSAELAKLSAFEDYRPRLLLTERYLPYRHTDVSHHGTVAVFELDHWAAQCICSVDFNVWNLANESSCADELLFWNQSQLKVQAIPYDGRIEFKGLSPSELKQLQDCERGISQHLYPA